MQPDTSVEDQRHYGLVADVDMRWNSVYLMFERALQLPNPVDAFIIGEESKHKIYPSNPMAKEYSPKAKQK